MRCSLSGALIVRLSAVTLPIVSSIVTVPVRVDPDSNVPVALNV